MQQTFSFADLPISAEKTISPEGYTGLYGFHKYWGKKPHELIAYVIEHLSQPGQIVVDPFLGSGSAAREAVIRRRRFIGFDVNPVAVELAHLITMPPRRDDILIGLRAIESGVKDRINKTYALEDGATATHYLWEANALKQVWVKGNAAVSRRELPTTQHDLALIASFEGYRSRNIRRPRFYSNGRINASADMTLDSLLTPRAQHNIDLLLEAIEGCPQSIQMPLKLCLTAASGQMTRMVFAVTGRGKTKGKAADKVEVGSWVIGYWRPRLHFEVNVWNCFENRVRKLLKALVNLKGQRGGEHSPSMVDVIDRKAMYHIALSDCREGLRKVPNESVSLVITDPPHSDRVPYLELSEFWNSLLGFNPTFDNEIVISNAKERHKNEDEYKSSMGTFFRESARILSDKGTLVVLFNAREREAWAAIRKAVESPTKSALTYTGCFPCNYSANSVVQDNRKGAMKSDWALVFSRSTAATKVCQGGGLSEIPGWTIAAPDHLAGV